MTVTAADVVAAAETIAGDIVRTHSERSDTLSAMLGCELTIKFENLQYTASFKDRGSANALHHLSADQRKAGVVALSAGNHAQGVAYHASRMGIPATIVMPTSAPFSKVRNTRALGATVVQEGATFAEAQETAERIMDQQGLTWLHPYADPHVIAGQGTCAVEMLADHNDLDVLLVPTGGGGLLSGVAAYARETKPDLEVIGVQSEVYPGMISALAGRPFESTRTDTLADGIAVKQPAELTVGMTRELVDDVIATTETSIERAIALLVEVEKTVSEGAGAVGLAAILDYPDRFAGRHVGVILSGGNIDTRILASVLMRELAHTDRITVLRVTIEDLPGQLAPVVNLLGQAGVNVLDIEHRRLFGPVSARRTQIDVMIESRNAQHTAQVLESLKAAGYRVELPDC